MLNFKLLANLSKNVNVILKALETSDLVEISQDRKKIRRSSKHPLPEFNEEYRKAQEARTVYVKGFSVTDTSIEKLKIFFDPYKPFETIVVSMNRRTFRKFLYPCKIIIDTSAINCYMVHSCL